MGSMNFNNWLSFPVSPTHSSLPTPLQSSQSHQFSLGLVNDNMENQMQIQEWNLINSSGEDMVPKVEDFLGVGNSGNLPQDHSALTFNQIQTTNSDHNLTNCDLQQVENSTTDANKNYVSQGNNSNMQSLTLSMGSGKGLIGESSTVENNVLAEVAPRRSIDTFGQRTSIYRGVTKHRWTGRYEAHLWDNSCRREGQSRKGRQVYLGGYDKEEKAARAYDLAALKYWGTTTTTNFPISNYERELEEMKDMTRQEFVASLRRKSSGFSRGASMYRGVTRHHQHGRWQARIGRVAGNKDLYLGTFTTEEEAAEAYDVAAIKFRGLNAVTNFDMNRYDVKSILESNSLPLGGGAARRLKESQAIESERKREEMKALSSSFHDGSSSSSFQGYPLLSQFEQPQPFLALQNPPNSHYSLEPPLFQQNFLHPHHHQQLHQQATPLLQPNQDSQFHHHGYLQNHPAMLHGLMNMGSSTSLVDSSGGSSNAYNQGFLGNGIVMAANPSTINTEGVGSISDVSIVKPDYDMSSGGYGGWSADSVHGVNSGFFTMWGDI